MKISDNYLVKQIVDDYILIPVGQSVIDYKSILNLNETSTFLCKCLQEETTYDELLAKYYAEYEPDEAEKQLLKYDMESFLYKAHELGVIEGDLGFELD